MRRKQRSLAVLASFQGNEEDLAEVLVGCRDSFSKEDVYVELETRYASASFDSLALAVWQAGHVFRQHNKGNWRRYLIDSCRAVIVSANL